MGCTFNTQTKVLSCSYWWCGLMINGEKVAAPPSSNSGMYHWPVAAWWSSSPRCSRLCDLLTCVTATLILMMRMAVCVWFFFTVWLLLVRGPHGSAGCPSIRACCRESSLKWTVHAIPFLSFCVIEKSIPMVRLCSLALLEKFWFFFPKNPLQKSDSKCLLRPDLCATLLFLDAVGCFSTMQPDVGKPEHSLYLQWKTDQ